MVEVTIYGRLQRWLVVLTYGNSKPILGPLEANWKTGLPNLLC